MGGSFLLVFLLSLLLRADAGALPGALANLTLVNITAVTPSTTQPYVSFVDEDTMVVQWPSFYAKPLRVTMKCFGSPSSSTTITAGPLDSSASFNLTSHGVPCEAIVFTATMNVSLLFNTPLENAGQSNGAWVNPSTWGLGRVPCPSDFVDIGTPANTNYLVQVNESVVVRSVRLMGPGAMLEISPGSGVIFLSSEEAVTADSILLQQGFFGCQSSSGVPASSSSSNSTTNATGTSTSTQPSSPSSTTTVSSASTSAGSGSTLTTIVPATGGGGTTTTPIGTTLAGEASSTAATGQTTATPGAGASTASASSTVAGGSTGAGTIAGGATTRTTTTTTTTSTTTTTPLPLIGGPPPPPPVQLASQGGGGGGGIVPIAAAAGGGGALLILLVIVFIVVRRRKARATQPAAGAERDDPYEIPRNNLALGADLGNGYYGPIRKAALTNHGVVRNVVVQTLAADAQPQQRNAMEAEMETLKSVQAPKETNVVRFVGYCTVRDPLLLVMADMEVKLVDHLREGRSKGLSNTDLSGFARQTVQGVQYLHSRGVVHRNLSASHVYVGVDGVCRVGDFARDTLLAGAAAVRWLAPECLQSRTFNVRADLWSLGVVLWEIMTYGATPYFSVPIAKLLDELMKGSRLPRPAVCPPEMFAVIARCWSLDPGRRPDTNELLAALSAPLLDVQGPAKHLPFSNPTAPPNVKVGWGDAGWDQSVYDMQARANGGTDEWDPSVYNTGTGERSNDPAYASAYAPLNSDYAELTGGTLAETSFSVGGGKGNGYYEVAPDGADYDIASDVYGKTAGVGSGAAGGRGKTKSAASAAGDYDVASDAYGTITKASDYDVATDTYGTITNVAAGGAEVRSKSFVVVPAAPEYDVASDTYATTTKLPGAAAAAVGSKGKGPASSSASDYDVASDSTYATTAGAVSSPAAEYATASDGLYATTTNAGASINEGNAINPTYAHATGDESQYDNMGNGGYDGVDYATFKSGDALDGIYSAVVNGTAAAYEGLQPLSAAERAKEEEESAYAYAPSESFGF